MPLSPKSQFETNGCLSTINVSALLNVLKSFSITLDSAAHTEKENHFYERKEKYNTWTVASAIVSSS